MSLGKQAKVLTDNQQKAVLGCIAARRHAARNTLMFLLSVDAGLRAKEIALLDWSMLTDLPPLKWSSLRYGFDHGGYDGEEEAYG